MFLQAFQPPRLRPKCGSKTLAAVTTGEGIGEERSRKKGGCERSIGEELRRAKALGGPEGYGWRPPIESWNHRIIE